MGMVIVGVITGIVSAIWSALNIAGLIYLFIDYRNSDYKNLLDFFMGDGCLSAMMKMYKEEGLPPIVVLPILMLPALIVGFSLGIVQKGIGYVAKLPRKTLSSLKGELLMKRKLFVALLLLVAGRESDSICNAVTDWWKAPSAKPSAEVQKLIDSLATADRWNIVTSMKTDGVECNDVIVSPGMFLADVYVRGQNCNGQFSYADRRSINKAAATCTQKVAARRIDNSISRLESVTYQDK